MVTNGAAPFLLLLLPVTAIFTIEESPRLLAVLNWVTKEVRTLRSKVRNN